MIIYFLYNKDSYFEITLENVYIGYYTLYIEDNKTKYSQLVMPQYYNGRIPACGIFCGGCPIYVKKKNPCQGATINTKRCENCKTFHVCCQSRGINHCNECDIFPCHKFRSFAKRWLKYGQDLIDNQLLLKEIGENKFREYFNLKVKAK